MKKTITIVILFIVFIIIYFLELNFFSWFTIDGIKPNLFILLILFIGLYGGAKLGTVLGLIFGFIIDVLGSSLIGVSALCLGVIGFLRRIFREEFLKR